MNILILGPNHNNKYNNCHQIFKNNIAKVHNVTFYGQGFFGINHPIISVPSIINQLKLKPDLILTNHKKYCRNFIGLAGINIPKVHIVVDYYPARGGHFGNDKAGRQFFAKNKYDIVFAPVTEEVKYLKRDNVAPKIFLLPFSTDTTIFRKLNIPKRYDVSTSYTACTRAYPNRNKVRQIIKKMGVTYDNNKVYHEEYIKKINETKIFVTENGVFNFLNMKYFETLACGTFLLANKPDDLELNGFKDGEHLVIYKDLNDLQDKIKYYLKNEDEREKIAKQGMEFVHKFHSCKQRVNEFTQIIEKELNIK